MIEGIKTGNIQAVAQALEQAVIDNMPATIYALLPHVTQPLLAVTNIQDQQVDYFLNRDLRQTANHVLKKMSATEKAPDQLATMTRQFCIYLAHLAEHHQQDSLANDLIKMQKLEQDCQDIAPLKQVLVSHHQKTVVEQQSLFQQNKEMLRKSIGRKPIILRKRPRPQP